MSLGTYWSVVLLGPVVLGELSDVHTPGRSQDPLKEPCPVAVRV